ncbi:MAG: nucleotide exchange factor GrpE [Candidatus Magasanikbacteria bacterium]|nr:nucleotide exchange factor GrpE [Candidatus Magasanikbacteria bacterium]
MDEDNKIPPEVENLEASTAPVCENCEKCKAEMEEYKSGWQRALADYKNLQKESADMRGVWAKASEQYILEEFIPVYENFKKAFAHKDAMTDEKSWKQWADGIGYIQKQFGDILKNYQVEEIQTAGEKFDPRYHEAIGEEESSEVESGIILKEVEGGYKRGDKIIKPARVIISK